MGDFEHSFAVAREAMRTMFDLRCPASPQSFELFHIYTTGRNKALNAELDAITSASGQMTEANVAKLWRKYCSHENGHHAVDEISSRLTGEIGQVLDMLNAAAGHSTQYSECLDTMSEQLGGGIDADALQIVVESLVETTKVMSAQSHEMEMRLRESREQIDRLKKDLHTVRSESLTDRLTGIANRKHFDERLKVEIESAELNGANLCLLIGDIDFFKKFNDSYGHQTGDQVLCLVGQALKSGLKGRDLAARYGGEEFAIILPDTTLEAGTTVGNNIRDTVRSKELVRKSTGENLGNITMSFGVACYRRGESPESLIERADACLYAAKRAGRNVVKSERDADAVAQLSSAVA